MPDTPYQHTPVLAQEVIDCLQIPAAGLLIDCTLGGGGHTEKFKLQNPNLKIIGIDQDADAIAAAKPRLANFENIEYVHDNFANLKEHVKEKADDVFFDLGVSSYQIDEGSRGFSFQKDGPLDMRMDREQPLTAGQIINRASPEEIEKIIRDYGEERFARRIARVIAARRPIRSTLQLRQVVEEAAGTWRRRETAARVFQAFRLAVNAELENLRRALPAAVDILRPGGRIVVIAYHSLEDRIVKHTFKEFSKMKKLKVLTKKPVLASREEVAANPRARSAKLRAAEKL